MSYCVNCGVELGEDLKKCPLCGTPVCNPNEPEHPVREPFFPEKQEQMAPVSKKELALLLSAMLASVAVCCGLLNLALLPRVQWWLYAAGAAGMLWIWFVLPLVWRKMPYLWKVFMNLCAVSVYVLLIALASGGLRWYWHLALPILLAGAVVVMAVCWMIRTRHHSILSSMIFVLLGIGLICAVMEFFIDRFLFSRWNPGWSLIVLAVCVGLSVPLIVVRRVPALREEARRRFHL